MGRTNYYDVYDLTISDIEPTLKHLRAIDIEPLIGIKRTSVATQEALGKIYMERYAITLAGAGLQPKESFATEWDRITEPFHKIRWVRQGGRKLYLNGGVVHDR